MASKYGIHSLNMLQFLWDNPGASSGEIRKHLWRMDLGTRSAARRGRGRFSYLLSPYYSKALAGDRMGNYPHPRCQRQTGNRGWFYRENGESGRFKYYITLKGYAYLFGENPSTSAFMQTTHN